MPGALEGTAIHSPAPHLGKEGVATKNRSEGSGHPVPSHLPTHQLGVDMEAPGLAPQAGGESQGQRGPEIPGHWLVGRGINGQSLILRARR